MEPKALQGIGIGDLNEAHKPKIFGLAPHLRLGIDPVFDLPYLCCNHQLVRPNRRLGIFELVATAF